MNTPVVFALLSLMISASALLYGMTRQRRRDSTSIEGRLTALETKVDVFWRALAVDAAQILHSPDPEKARQDDLLDQFMAGGLRGAEMLELVQLLEEIREDHDALAGERLAASVVLQAITARYE